MRVFALLLVVCAVGSAFSLERPHVAKAVKTSQASVSVRSSASRLMMSDGASVVAKKSEPVPAKKSFIDSIWNENTKVQKNMLLHLESSIFTISGINSFHS